MVRIPDELQVAELDADTTAGFVNAFAANVKEYGYGDEAHLIVGAFAGVEANPTNRLCRPVFQAASYQDALAVVVEGTLDTAEKVAEVEQAVLCEMGRRLKAGMDADGEFALAHFNAYTVLDDGNLIVAGIFWPSDGTAYSWLLEDGQFHSALLSETQTDQLDSLFDGAAKRYEAMTAGV